MTTTQTKTLEDLRSGAAPMAWHGLSMGGHIFTTFVDEDGVRKGRDMGLTVVPVFSQETLEAIEARALAAEAKVEALREALAALIHNIDTTGGTHGAMSDARRALTQEQPDVGE